MIADLLIDHLSKQFKVEHVKTGVDVSDAVASFKPDIIVLDFDLPGKKADDILRELKADQETENIPTLILTNMSDSASVSRIIDAGGREYLVKSDWPLDAVAEKIASMV